MGYGLAAAELASAAAILSSVRSSFAFRSDRRRCADADLFEAARLTGIDTRKMDRISLLTMAAVRRALAQAPLGEAELGRCGMYVGNALAGWGFAEPELETMYRRGPLAVSPYLATAWFPAAPQGHTTITLGMHGVAKTVTTDRCAGAQAIALAAERIRHGDPRPYLAGGVEAPLTRFVQAAYQGSQLPPEYLCEAASFLVLAPVALGAGHVEIGHTITRRATNTSVEAMVEMVARRTADGPPVCAIVIDAHPGRGTLERLELLLDRTFDRNVERLRPGFFAGDSLAASSALGVVLACELLRQRKAASSVLAISVGHQCTTSISLHRRSA